MLLALFVIWILLNSVYYSTAIFEDFHYLFFGVLNYFLIQFGWLCCAIGLGQVQLKLGDFRSSLANFEKVLEAYPDSVESMKVSQKIGSFRFVFPV